MPWGAISSKSRCIEPSLPTSPQLRLDFDSTFIQPQPNNQNSRFISFQTIFHNWFQLQLNCHSSSTRQSQLSFHPISTPTQPELSLNLNLNPYHANSFQERQGPLKEHQDQLPGHSDSLPNDPKSLPELQDPFPEAQDPLKQLQEPFPERQTPLPENQDPAGTPLAAPSPAPPPAPRKRRRLPTGSQDSLCFPLKSGYLRSVKI